MPTPSLWLSSDTWYPTRTMPTTNPCRQLIKRRVTYKRESHQEIMHNLGFHTYFLNSCEMLCVSSWHPYLHLSQSWDDFSAAAFRISKHCISNLWMRARDSNTATAKGLSVSWLERAAASHSAPRAGSCFTAKLI